MLPLERQMKINVQLYTPTLYQKRLLDYVISNPTGKRVSVIAPRQCGKSYTICNLLAYFALTHSGTESILFEPSYKQCQNQFKTIVDNLGKVCEGNKSDMVITFCNKSTIRFLSAEQAEETLRGYTCSGLLVYDEASSIKDDIFAITKPYANVSNCTIIYVSTPKFKQGTFYHYCTDEHAQHFVWKIEDNPFITEEQLADIRRTTPPNLFKSEYLGEWLDMSGDVFGDFSHLVTSTYSTMDGNVAGLDWGSGNNADDTAFVAFNQMHEMTACEHWNDLGTTETIDKVVMLVKRHRIATLVAERNSIGSVYLDLLKKRLKGICRIVEFNTSNDSKRDIIESLQVAINNGELTILNDNELMLQLSSYEMEKTPTGKITYNGHGTHDDLVIAMALAYYNFKQHRRISYV